MPENKKALAPVDEFKLSVDRMSPEFGKILPSHVSPEKFVRVLKTAASLRPEIASADRRTLYGEIMKCAQDGLVPDGREATINVYKSKSGPPTAKYIPMIAGVLKKLRNSGLVPEIDAIVVYKEDLFNKWTDENGHHFRHEEAEGDRGPVRCTIAFAKTSDGGKFFEKITEDQMAAIEASSMAKTGPWKGPFKDEMRRKSAIKRLAKRLPSSSDIEKLMQRDEDLYSFPEKDNRESSPDESIPPKREGPSRLKDAIDAHINNKEEATTTTLPPAPAEPDKKEEPPI